MDYTGTPKEVRAALAEAATGIRDYAQTAIRPLREALAHLDSGLLRDERLIRIQIVDGAPRFFKRVQAAPADLPICDGCPRSVCERCL